MELMTIEKDELRLNSFMDEMAFGKTNYNSIVTQTGLLITCSLCDNEKYDFTFEDWSFSEVKSFVTPDSDGHSIVFYCGNNPLSENAKSLLDFYQQAGKENASIQDKNLMFDSSFLICSILTYAATEKINIPVNGAGGILIDFISEKTAKVLFLPPNLFKYSSAGLSQIDYANNYLCWVNPTLYDLPAICFFRAVIAYKMLTGRFPYAASDSTERNADILDRKFLPLELCVNGLDEELALQINKALKLNSNAFAIPGKKKKGKNSEDLTPTAEFPLSLLLETKTSVKTSTTTDEELQEKAQNYIKHRDSKINAKRTIRRNTSVIITVAIVVTIVGLIIGNTVNSNLNSYDSRGLTSSQTIEVFFKGINDKDTVLLDNLIKGKNPSHYIDTVSQIYVLTKSRQAYNYGDQGFSSPARWCFFVKNAATNEKAGVYGVTNVKVDGKLSNLNPPLYTKKEKIPPVTEENGITLKKGSKSVHLVDYYLLHSEGEGNGFYVDKITDTFTLTYERNRWIITNISSDAQELPIDDYTFKSDWFNAILFANEDPIRAAQVLKAKYDWLPTTAILQAEKKQIEQEKLDPIFGMTK